MAAAEAALASAQASVEVIRLTRPRTHSIKEHYPAIIIQTAFRGYLVSKENHLLRFDKYILCLIVFPNNRQWRYLHFRITEEEINYLQIPKLTSSIRNGNLVFKITGPHSCLVGGRQEELYVHFRGL